MIFSSDHFDAEKDTNDEVLWVWSYPGVDGALRNLLMRKCNLDMQTDGNVEALPFMFGHFLQIWYYFLNFRVEEGNPKFPKVSLLLSLCWHSINLTIESWAMSTVTDDGAPFFLKTCSFFPTSHSWPNFVPLPHNWLVHLIVDLIYCSVKIMFSFSTCMLSCVHFLESSWKAGGCVRLGKLPSWYSYPLNCYLFVIVIPRLHRSALSSCPR